MKSNLPIRLLAVLAIAAIIAGAAAIAINIIKSLLIFLLSLENKDYVKRTKEDYLITEITSPSS